LLNKNIEDIKKEPDLFNKFLELNKKGLWALPIDIR
jgi:hypothetical protein